MNERLPAHVEVSAIMRRVEAEGGFATMLRRGDPDRGAVVLYIQKRGDFCGILERELGPNFTYDWVFKTDGSETLGDLIARKSRFDPDFWLIELDVAEPERFIAETTGSG
ncbi:hypothetical protein GCM10023264_16430 [Sphingomonas daechungensis]|uniref:DUF1491 family protein n=2 Tax=Sphingomonas daechungensis TaxID=1176646 RepID=A0ABX6T2M5_9SPHN|nr:DUF1491 family protein [Sphingomonas daechungensis]